MNETKERLNYGGAQRLSYCSGADGTGTSEGTVKAWMHSNHLEEEQPEDSEL